MIDSSEPFVIIAIDGGAATGKSTTAGAVSARFHLLHVDTGAFYRTITLALLEAGVSPCDAAAVARALPGLAITTGARGRRAVMELNGGDPAARLREPRVNENVSHFAALDEVRDFLLEYQRGQADVALEHGFRGLVMEGRDIGSVIFPDADFRFFLQAEESERTRRRALQGETDEIGKRDAMDAGRKSAPLICPPGAMTINTTALSLDEVVETISREVETRLPRACSA